MLIIVGSYLLLNEWIPRLVWSTQNENSFYLIYLIESKFLNSSTDSEYFISSNAEELYHNYSLLFYIRLWHSNALNFVLVTFKCSLLLHYQCCTRNDGCFLFVSVCFCTVLTPTKKCLMKLIIFRASMIRKLAFTHLYKVF